MTICDNVTRAICRSRNEYDDHCVAVKQPDGQTSCPCGKWPAHMQSAPALTDAMLAAAAEPDEETGISWHMRPDEATESMAVAGCRHENMGDMAGRYRAMLADPTAQFEWDK